MDHGKGLLIRGRQHLLVQPSRDWLLMADAPAVERGERQGFSSTSSGIPAAASHAAVGYTTFRLPSWFAPSAIMWHKQLANITTNQRDRSARKEPAAGSYQNNWDASPTQYQVAKPPSPDDDTKPVTQTSRPNVMQICVTSDPRRHINAKSSYLGRCLQIRLVVTMVKIQECCNLGAHRVHY